MYKSGMCNTKPAISLKRCTLEPKLLQTAEYGLLIGDKSGDLESTFSIVFRATNFSTVDISHTFCQSAMKFVHIRGLANRNLFPDFHELSSDGPFDTMWQHASILYWCICKVVFLTTSPCLSIGFRLVSIYCVAQRLDASFLYKCPASRGSSLCQHGLLIKLWCPYHHTFGTGEARHFRFNIQVGHIKY